MSFELGTDVRDMVSVALAQPISIHIFV
jgi:hypothetical protein